MIPSTSPRRAHQGAVTLAAASIALLLGAAGCGVGEVDPDLDLDSHAKIQIQCPAVVEAWTPTISYKVGDVRTFNGGTFQCRAAHTPATNWNPIDAASLWLQVDCKNAPATPPTNNPPPTNSPPPTSSPPPTNNPVITNKGGEEPGFGRCSSFATGLPGPAFDAAGVNKVGNGHGGQFITGRCLSNADCGSGSCAGPCGVCSGPAVCNAAGKTGCGFEFSKVILDR